MGKRIGASRLSDEEVKKACEVRDKCREIIKENHGMLCEHGTSYYWKCKKPRLEYWEDVLEKITAMYKAKHEVIRNKKSKAVKELLSDDDSEVSDDDTLEEIIRNLTDMEHEEEVKKPFESDEELDLSQRKKVDKKRADNVEVKKEEVKPIAKKEEVKPIAKKEEVKPIAKKDYRSIIFSKVKGV